MRRTARAAFAALIVLLTCALAAPGAAAPRAQSASYDEYVALGDSYTAGPLIPTLRLASGCFRSTNNYPALLAQRLGVETFRDVSCSGADTADMTSRQQTSLGSVPAQFAALDDETDLVTVGVGGNDGSVFGELVGFCTTLRATDPTGSPCRDHFGADGRDELRERVDRTTTRLIAVVRGIRARSPEARVLVVGYPQIAPLRGTCPGLLPLADGDYRYATEIERALNAGLRLAAKRNRADYVNAFRVSRGHHICATDPWINGQHTDPARAQRYHPFASGMVGVADAVEAALQQ